MIQANDLRIGNWIADRGGKEWQIDHWESKNKVSAKEPEFNTCGMTLKAHPLTEYVDYLKPIPITEEWLLRFGFDVVHKKNQHYSAIDPNGYKDMYKISVFKSINDVWHIAFSDVISGKYQDYIPTTKIKYIHQLQNLYHALTGEELPINQQPGHSEQTHP